MRKLKEFAPATKSVKQRLPALPQHKGQLKHTNGDSPTQRRLRAKEAMSKSRRFCSAVTTSSCPAFASNTRLVIAFATVFYVRHIAAR